MACPFVRFRDISSAEPSFDELQVHASRERNRMKSHAFAIDVIAWQLRCMWRW